MECSQSFHPSLAWVGGLEVDAHQMYTDTQTPSSRPSSRTTWSHRQKTRGSKIPSPSARTSAWIWTQDPRFILRSGQTPGRLSACPSMPVKTAAGWSTVWRCSHANPWGNQPFSGDSPIRAVRGFCWPNNEHFQSQAAPGLEGAEGSFEPQWGMPRRSQIHDIIVCDAKTGQTKLSQVMVELGHLATASRCHFSAVAMTDILK